MSITLKDLSEFWDDLSRGRDEPDYIVCDHYVYSWICYIQTHPIVERVGNYAKRLDEKWHRWYGITLTFDPRRLP